VIGSEQDIWLALGLFPCCMNSYIAWQVQPFFLFLFIQRIDFCALQMRVGATESDKACEGDLFQGSKGNHGRQDPQPIYEVVSSIIILASCLWICGLAWCEGWGHTSWKYATEIPSFRAHETSHKWTCVCIILTCTFNVVCSSFQFSIGWSLEKVKVVMGVLDRGHSVHNELFLQIPCWWEGDYEVCH